MNMHFRFIIEEIRHSGKQSVTFILCVALSLATLTALNSFKRNVYQSLVGEARILHGADIVIHSHHPISESVIREVDQYQQENRLSSLKTYEFYSVVRPDDKETSLFSSIKVVDSGYPHYGTVKLLSGRDLQQVLQPGKIVVAQALLDRLGVTTGSYLHIGNAVLEISDVVLYESARPVAFFSFGPRIFVSSSDIDKLGLMGMGSRAEYEILLKINSLEEVGSIHRQIKQRALSGQERVETAQEARSGIKRFFDNLLFFLSFISIFTLLLSGIGMQGALSAMFRQKQKTIAVVKALGSSYRFLLGHYLAIVLLLGFTGSVCGLVMGTAIKQFFPLLFHELLPDNIGLALSLYDIAQSLSIGLIVVTLFTFLPLYQLSQVKPVEIFRSEKPLRSPNKTRYIIMGLGGLFLLLLVVKQLEDVKTGIIFSAGLLTVIAVITFVTMLILKLIRRIPVSNLALRQAMRSLFRTGNATRSIIVTLTSALTVLLTIFLLKLNLFATFVDSYPEDAPNLFCLDIQKDQKDLFYSLVGSSDPLFPVIRARLLSVNGTPIDQELEKKRKSDNLGREFNLTYREDLLKDEIIVKGDALFGSGDMEEGVVPVSILDTIGDIGKFSINDRLLFNIQGVQIDAQVVSIRTRTQSKLSPFFYFVFEPQVLESAPQTLFAALHVQKELIPEMITTIVTKMPHVSTINVSELALQFGALLSRLSGVITFFASFSIAAGCLILVSSIFATHMERVKEVVFYKVLGGKSRFVFLVVTYENMIVGVISSIMALVLANISCWLLCKYVFEITYQSYFQLMVITILLTVLMVVGIALVSSMRIIKKKPVTYLRQYNGA
jgi:putative ABC transport system permease protein